MKYTLTLCSTVYTLAKFNLEAGSSLSREVLGTIRIGPLNVSGSFLKDSGESPVYIIQWCSGLTPFFNRPRPPYVRIGLEHS